jgi:hypothetical protein
MNKRINKIILIKKLKRNCASGFSQLRFPRFLSAMVKSSCSVQQGQEFEPCTPEGTILAGGGCEADCPESVFAQMEICRPLGKVLYIFLHYAGAYR